MYEKEMSNLLSLIDNSPEDISFTVYKELCIQSKIVEKDSTSLGYPEDIFSVEDTVVGFNYHEMAILCCHNHNGNLSEVEKPLSKNELIENILGMTKLLKIDTSKLPEKFQNYVILS